MSSTSSAAPLTRIVRELRAPILLLLLLLVPFASGCVLAIGNKIPEDEFNGTDIEVSSASEPSGTVSATAAGARTVPAGGAASDEESKKLHALERELEANRRKLHIAELERESAVLAEQKEAAKLGAELEVARARLAIFREMTLPARTRSADLDLESQRHRLQDAQDELRQLEMLYTGAELEDRTSEIVLARGRRQLEHTQGRLEVAEIERNRVVERELPIEAGEKERELGKAEFAVAQSERAIEISRMKAESDLAELRSKIEDSERELAALTKARTGATGIAPASSSPAGGGSGAAPGASPAAPAATTGSPR